MKTVSKITFCCAVALALAGCSSAPSKTTGMPGTYGANGGANGGVITNGIGGSGGFDGQSFGTGGGLANLSPQDQAQLTSMQRTVYFAFNSNSLDSSATNVAQANASFLLQHPGVSVLLAGNTDPRGSQEYNFHLGQRRADAVQSYLLQQGVSAQQICTVSYGELKPAASPQADSGNWQEAYRLDRRVDITYGQSCQGMNAAVEPSAAGATGSNGSSGSGSSGSSNSSSAIDGAF